MPQSNWSDIGKTAFQYSQEFDGYVCALADWVECQALTRVAYGCDKATLTSALKIDNWTPPANDISITHDALAEDVFVELRDRAADYGKRGYPFECDYAGRRLKFSEIHPWPYVFLLALSYTNPVTKVKSTLPAGSYVLEALAWTGLDRFIGQPASDLSDLAACHHLGSPSLSKLPMRFDDKVDCIAAEFKEGGQYKPWQSGHRQASGDDGVDILLRRGFPDTRGAQFLVFGGCAGGQNWSTPKRYEVDPDRWLTKNFQERFQGISGMGRCYFLPRQIDADGWSETAKTSGMVVDRCRLALITHKSKSHHLTTARKWTEALCGKVF